ncbi:sulfite exporter TauE/SafE family protein [Oscillospiraceae bacterium OttesenSCG-928-F05]|nr:sulfite exporter TauE/SafE family protein [Oscillospiraceae bacterium OttesenSCG-928-F05]
MEPLVIVLFVLSILFGIVVQSMTGFGFGIVVMTLMPFFMPSYGLSLAISTVLGVLTSYAIAVQCRKDIEWRLLWVPFITSAVANTLAVWISSTQPDDLLKIILGIFLVLLGIYFQFFSSKIRIKANKRNGAIAGVLSGVLSGLFGMGGPPMVVYFLAASDDDKKYMANTQAFFAMTNTITVVNRAVNKQLTMDAVPYIVTGLFLIAIGTFLGRKIRDRIQPGLLRRFVYIMVSAGGVALILRSILQG